MSQQDRRTSAERRSERRAPAEISLTLSDHTGEPIAAATRNLSASGAYVLLEEPLPVFAKYQTHLLLPGIDEDGEATVEDIEAVAIVVRHDVVPGDGDDDLHYMALYFDQVSLEHRELLIGFVDGSYD